MSACVNAEVELSPVMGRHIRSPTGSHRDSVGWKVTEVKRSAVGAVSFLQVVALG
jgi:hypothetical protein